LLPMRVHSLIPRVTIPILPLKLAPALSVTSPGPTTGMRTRSRRAQAGIYETMYDDRIESIPFRQRAAIRIQRP
jgi:hypothetical protein